LANDVKTSVQNALAKLLAQDSDLLQNDVNERSITHKLAEHLKGEFQDWHVDCEYNRNHDRVKRLKFVKNRAIEIDDTDGTSVFPDIIVHRRQTDENLLVIEVKKSTSPKSKDFDLAKLQAFKEELGYTHALFILLGTGERHPEPKLIWIDEDE
jgi:hypothetical protein